MLLMNKHFDLVEAKDDSKQKEDMGLFEKLNCMLSNKMIEVTRYQNMWETNDMERALQRYHTNKDSLDADSVHFQPIDDMRITAVLSTLSSTMARSAKFTMSAVTTK